MPTWVKKPKHQRLQGQKTTQASKAARVKNCPLGQKCQLQKPKRQRLQGRQSHRLNCWPGAGFATYVEVSLVLLSKSWPDGLVLHKFLEFSIVSLLKSSVVMESVRE